MEQRPLKDQLARFGRAFALLLNRCQMYQSHHPFVQEAVNDTIRPAQLILAKLTPLVFILNREQFYVDEEPLDKRINVKRIVHQFKNAGIQSISFERGLEKMELDLFVHQISQAGLRTNAEQLKQTLTAKGVYTIKINHVVYKKVTEDDQVVSRQALKRVTPIMDSDDRQERKKFLDTLLESTLSDEFAHTLNIQSLLQNPAAFSRKMIEADKTGAGQVDPDSYSAGAQTLPLWTVESDQGPQASRTGQGDGSVAGTGNTAGAVSGDGLAIAGSDAEPTGGISHVNTDRKDRPDTSEHHGMLLLHQLELMHTEVKKHLHGEGDVDLADLAQAVFEMKKQLLEGIQTQKTLGVAYGNEPSIIANANALADSVVVELVREEYLAGQITTQRLAMIIHRLIPEASELRRLLPKLKSALLEAGMPLPGYLKLINELSTELQNEELARILSESSEAIGVDSDLLIKEVKSNPDHAAELIYLASEIRKGTGDESVLSDILVDYVERIGQQMALDTDGQDEDHLRKVIKNVESGILQRLARTELAPDAIQRMEERLNERMDGILDKMRVEWLNAQSGKTGPERIKPLSVIQTLENNVQEDEDLSTILQLVRAKVDAGDIEENDFSRIHAEILRQKRLRDAKAQGDCLPAEILNPDELMYVIEKEIARADRYNAPFSALAFSFVKAKPKMEALKNLVTIDDVLLAACETLVETFREVDFIGQIGKNKMVVILPMIGRDKAKVALERVLRLFHAQPLIVKDVPMQLRVAGVAIEYDENQAADARLFARQISNQLMDMVARVKNIQVLF